MTQSRRSARVGAATAAAALLAATGTAAHGAQGSGNPSLRISTATLSADRATTVTVTGTDYLVPPHAPGANVFGGVYLFFGWVKPGIAWGPSAKTSTSNDGNFGFTFHYAGDGGDPATRDDGSGTMRMVSFTAGGESGNATSFHMDDAGNWTTTLVVHGATYQYQDPTTGQARTVDCRTVQCGVYTIGAHGKASRTNERFTPIAFTGTSPVTPLPGQPVPSGAGTTATTRPPATGTGGVAAGAAGPSSTSTSTTVAPEPEPGLPETGGETAAPPAARSPAAADAKRIAATAAVSDGGGTSAWTWAVAGVVVAGGAAGAAWYVRRRRAPATDGGVRTG
jgi:hypothetical protein